jgi:hypothetical protein
LRSSSRRHPRLGKIYSAGYCYRPATPRWRTAIFIRNTVIDAERRGEDPRVAIGNLPFVTFTDGETDPQTARPETIQSSRACDRVIQSTEPARPPAPLPTRFPAPTPPKAPLEHRLFKIEEILGFVFLAIAAVSAAAWFFDNFLGVCTAVGFLVLMFVGLQLAGYGVAAVFLLAQTMWKRLTQGT